MIRHAGDGFGGSSRHGDPRAPKATPNRGRDAGHWRNVSSQSHSSLHGIDDGHRNAPPRAPVRKLSHRGASRAIGRTTIMRSGLLRSLGPRRRVLAPARCVSDHHVRRSSGAFPPGLGDLLSTGWRQTRRRCRRRGEWWFRMSNLRRSYVFTPTRVGRRPRHEQLRGGSTAAGRLATRGASVFRAPARRGVTSSRTATNRGWESPHRPARAAWACVRARGRWRRGGPAPADGPARGRGPPCAGCR